MILSDSEILKQMAFDDIVIIPFNRDQLGSNSYDVRLGKILKQYCCTFVDASVFYIDASPFYIDSRNENQVKEFVIPEEGIILQPGKFYLAVTEEYTETHKCVPYLEGKSSLARLGISIHQTAGKGDVGFCGYWTMEITVAIPVRVYAGMKIGQLIYNEVKGEVLTPYNLKESAKYNNKEATPIESKNHENF
jgi:dCTP deaminase